MRFVNSVLAAVFGLVVVLFAVSNRLPVTVEIWPLPYQISLSLYALILLAVLIGFIAGMIAAWMIGRRRRRDHKRLHKQLRAMEQSLAQHRATTPGDFS